MEKINRKVAVIGLGYVGLPVAVAFAQQGPVIAYDKALPRIRALQQGFDDSGEIATEILNNKALLFTHNPEDLHEADFYIIAVPTPVNSSNQPDLDLLFMASKTIGRHLKPGDIVVYESTVYPGATEDECKPILETTSGLTCDIDFSIGYSPERINPGDPYHRFENITKIVSASNPEALSVIAALYGQVIQADIYCAPSIRTAEAAKIIENTQRDLNIALMNEFAIILNRMNIDTQSVLAAAQTKWNFLPFKPGLVGGHCIGVDPYYLTYQAQRYGYHPQVILAGRRINDHVGKYIAEQTIKKMIQMGYTVKGARVAILGLTFKANCRDLRNSKVIDIILELKDYHIDCFVHDPYANPILTKELYDIELISWEDIRDVNAIIIAVDHYPFSQYDIEEYHQKLSSPSLIMDVNGLLNAEHCQKNGIVLWRL